MWSIREDFVAIFVGQAPMVYPIFKKSFWNGISSTNANEVSGGETHEMRSGMSHSGKPKDPYSLTQIGVTRIDPTESQENIIKAAKEGESSGDERSQKQPRESNSVKDDADGNKGFSERVQGPQPPTQEIPGFVRVEQSFQLETSSNHSDLMGHQAVVTPWTDSRGASDGRAY